jgi:hypothetical protein
VFLGGKHFARFIVSISILLFLSAIPFLFASKAHADEPIVDWGGSGIGVWHEDESGTWVDMPFEDPEIQKAYKYKVLCILNDESDVDPLCIARAKCNAGKDGKPVRWFERFLAGPPDAWSEIRPDRCVYTEDPSDVLGRIAAQIQRQFEQLPVNAGASRIQPSPHTLRGAETNFYARADEQQFDITILAQKIHIVAKPVQYRWAYGDGTSLGPTTTMGGPLPQDRWGEKTRTSHAYAETGDFSVVLTTYFQGTYSVNGGPALPIPNEGQFSAAPQTVSVWRSVTRNYADDCITNPRGQGCPGAAAGNK